MNDGQQQEHAVAHSWPLRALAELLGDIGGQKFPDLFAGDEEEAGSPAKGKMTEKTRAKALRLLAVVAEDDLSLEEAADKLCISIYTANQHIAAARRVFGAATTHGAIYAAMQQGLIEA